MFQNRKQHNYAANINREILCNLGYFYRINKLFLDVDYTGNVYGPMRLPLLGDLDPGENIPQLGVFKTFNLRSINSRILKSMAVSKHIKWTPNKGNLLLLLGQTIHLIEMYNLILTAMKPQQQPMH
jgi:hypothetical protein